MKIKQLLPVLFIFLSGSLFAQAYLAGYNVKNYGARGDGKNIDSDAINLAIEAASQAGGGTVLVPAGKYLCYSIRLKSNISLYLDQGATIIAAETTESKGYDDPEPNIWGDSLKYQDFGHSHWHNSLIWGENLEGVSILGQGLIDGHGLVRFGSSKARKSELLAKAAAKKPLTANDSVNMDFLSMKGLGNKAIALKLCKNVTIRDISILNGGHFAILATGVNNLTIDNLKVDSNRDGIDIDACNNVRVSNCAINVPWDDGLCLKASYALGYIKHCENITISNCYVSGFDRGTMLDGTYQKGPDQKKVPDKGGVFGRIKLGTESNGDFRNIAITNCVFENSRGIALESVDGSNLEDISISNITMRNVTSSPIFLHLGNRMRGPANTPPGHIRRVSISNLVAYNANPDFCSLISSISGQYIEDIMLSNIRIWYQGGGTRDQAAITVPEKEKAYPDPQMYGVLPASGFFIRHTKNLKLNDIELHFINDDYRPALIFDDVHGAELTNIRVTTIKPIPSFVFRNSTNIQNINCTGLSDKR
jgi:polygalacturonase